MKPLLKRIRNWFADRRRRHADDLERWRHLLDERDGKEPNPWGDDVSPDVERWRRLLAERRTERAQLSSTRRMAIAALVAVAVLGGTVTAAVTFRSAIPFGSASSWSSAVGTDPNASQGTWVKSNGHQLYHSTAGLDYQLDTSAYFVTAYGAIGDGITDDTAAIQAAFTAAPAGSYVYFPPGTYLVTSQISITKNYTHVVFAGVLASQIYFNPSTTAILFDFSSGASIHFGSSMTGGVLIFSKIANTQTKTAIRINDASGMVIQDVWIDDSDGVNTVWTGNAGGTNSIGIQLRGREMATIDRIRVRADRPLDVVSDPNVTSPVNLDHTHFSNTYLVCTPGNGEAVLNIADGVIVTNFVVDGDNAWIPDKFGVNWVETSSPGVSYNVDFAGIRLEQASDLTGYSFNLSDTTGLYNVHLRDIYNATTNNFIQLKTVNNITLENVVTSTQDAAKKHINVISGVHDLLLVNDYWQTLTTATLSGLTLIWALPQVQSASTLPPTGWYSDSTTATNVPVQFGGTSKFLGSIQTLAGSTLDTSASGTWQIGSTNMTTLHINNNGGSKWDFNAAGLTPTTDKGVSIASDSFRVATSVFAGVRLSGDAATSGVTTQSGGSLTSRGWHWNGSSSVNDDLAIQQVVDSTTPTSHALFAIGGAEKARLDSAGTFVAKGGLGADYRTAASTVTVVASDFYVGVSGTGARTVNLPAANTLRPGQEIVFQDVGNDVGVITINRAGADTINGAATTTIAAAFGSKSLVCDGVSAWFAR